MITNIKFERGKRYGTIYIMDVWMYALYALYACMFGSVWT